MWFNMAVESRRSQALYKWERISPLMGWKLRIAIKGALSGLRQFLTIKSPLKMMKNAFHFTSKALFVLKISKFLSWLFSLVAKTAGLER